MRNLPEHLKFTYYQEISPTWSLSSPLEMARFVFFSILCHKGIFTSNTFAVQWNYKGNNNIRKLHLFNQPKLETPKIRFKYYFGSYTSRFSSLMISLFCKYSFWWSYCEILFFFCFYTFKKCFFVIHYHL